MPSTRDIRRRIKSVKSTAQITKAMQLVAAAKMKKAQDQATNGRAYAETLNKILVALREAAEDGSHPYFDEGKGDKTLVVVIASDKGLCGALNTNLFKKLLSANLEGDVDYVTVGIRISEEDEVSGLDVSQHGERAYIFGGSGPVLGIPEAIPVYTEGGAPPPHSPAPTREPRPSGSGATAR